MPGVVTAVLDIMRALLERVRGPFSSQQAQTMPGAVSAVLDIVRELLERDYAECFAPRFESASRVEKGTVLLEALEELRNAFDHLSRAILLARAAEGGPPPRIGKEEIVGDPLIDATRARRHLAAGEYYSLYYIATCRIRDTERLLQSDLTKNAIANRERFFDELDGCMNALSLIDLPRLTTDATHVSEIEAEIQRTQDIRDQLDPLVVHLNSLWRHAAQSAGYRLF